MNTAAEKNEQEKLKELLARADGHPMMQAIRQEETAACLARRKATAGRIEELKRERAETIPPLRADLTKMEGEVHAARAALDAATSAYKELSGRRLREELQFDIAIQREESDLLRTADPMIDQAITFFNEKLDYLRTPGRIDWRLAADPEKDMIRWKKTTKHEGNVFAIGAALEYCRAAIKELELMKLAPELPADRIERLKAEIPSIDQYTLFEGQKNLEGAHDPLAGLPSDSELAWRIGSIMERAGRLLRR